jgi:hypothetical protein
MIWSTTTHVGMAFAISPSGATYVVARYSPPGNILGESPQQATTSNREGDTPANTIPPYNQRPMSTPFSNAHHKPSPYGHNPHLRPQRYSVSRLTAPDALGRQHVYQIDTGPGTFSSVPPPHSRRMPVSHTVLHSTPYGSPYSHGPGPYGGGAPGPWSYASAVPPVGYGGHRSRGSSAALCCTVM